jgi:TRAP-type C4-dicarboxylate transport system permease small subunit
MTSTIKTHPCCYIIILANIIAIAAVICSTIMLSPHLSAGDISFNIFALTLNLAAIIYAMIAIIKAKQRNQHREQNINFQQSST